jgi:hypothetical protein
MWQLCLVQLQGTDSLQDSCDNAAEQMLPVSMQHRAGAAAAAEQQPSPNFLQQRLSAGAVTQFPHEFR